VNTLDKVSASNPNGYDCTALLDNKTDSWSNSWTDTIDVDNSGTSPVNTTNQVGTYNIGIKCTSISLPEKTDTVKLKVISSTVKEI
jgi:hypothetical protein